MASAVAPPPLATAPPVADATVSSTADLMSMVGDDVLAELSAINNAPDEPASPEPDVIDSPDGIETAPAEAEPPAEVEAAPAEATPAAKDDAPPAAEPDELPEGVSKGSRKGQEGYFVTPERWKAIYGDHQIVAQHGAEVIGEPITLEALKDRQAGYDSYHNLMADARAGDPQAQANFINFLFSEMGNAVQNGLAPADQKATFAATFYNSLKQAGTEDPAYRAVRYNGARDLINELYQEAATEAAAGNQALAKSLQHVVRVLTGNPVGASPEAVKSAAERAGLAFHQVEQLQALPRDNDPVTRLQRENEILRRQMSNRQQTTQVETFDSWQKGSASERQQAVKDEVIMPAIASAKEAWSKLPEKEQANFQRLVVEPLANDINNILAKDENFQSTISRLESQARRATSSQMRDSIKAQIKQAFVNRAKLNVESLKREHVTLATRLLAQASAAKHDRLKAGANRTSVQGTSAPVPRGIVPTNIGEMPNGTFDPSFAVKQAQALLRGS